MCKQRQELKGSSCRAKTDKNKVLRETEDFILISFACV